MVGNKITQTIKKQGRKFFLADGSKCDITQVRYFWKRGVPYKNAQYLNTYMLREMFREVQYGNK